MELSDIHISLGQIFLFIDLESAYLNFFYSTTSANVDQMSVKYGSYNALIVPNKQSLKCI